MALRKVDNEYEEIFSKGYRQGVKDSKITASKVFTWVTIAGLIFLIIKSQL